MKSEAFANAVLATTAIENRQVMNERKPLKFRDTSKLRWGDPCSPNTWALT